VVTAAAVTAATATAQQGNGISHFIRPVNGPGHWRDTQICMLVLHISLKQFCTFSRVGGHGIVHFCVFQIRDSLAFVQQCGIELPLLLMGLHLKVELVQLLVYVNQ